MRSSLGAVTLQWPWPWGLYTDLMDVTVDISKETIFLLRTRYLSTTFSLLYGTIFSTYWNVHTIDKAILAAIILFTAKKVSWLFPNYYKFSFFQLSQWYPVQIVKKITCSASTGSGTGWEINWQSAQRQWINYLLEQFNYFGDGIIRSPIYDLLLFIYKV